eukprot:TRINITY_DN10910_c0_g1_i1.p1 TRINITY_DN10910_c0_g1~~TRINITY_DN10910_c0_g1_i1.p1  ORF type:complete len:153 (+),score=37.11 TRINITY_DN10910_c0_g1_i1:80-538(+)
MGGALTKTQQDQLKSLFQKIDGDGDGLITSGELGKFLVKATPQQISQIMKAADKNGDNKIDYNEFVTVVGGKASEIWKKYDHDDSGMLTLKEVQQAYTSDVIGRLPPRLVRQDIVDKLAKADAVKDIKKWDKDGDGSVTFEEFCHFILETLV